MARIPAPELDRLKTDIAVEGLVEGAGIELKRGGKDLVGRCPFHEDDTASLVVTPAKNLWHCFGCGAAGGPIDWVMKLRGVSFRHAVELLKADPALAAGALADHAGTAPARTTVRALPAPVALDADEQTLLDQVIDYYAATLQQSPEALAYLQARGIADTEAIGRFKLGYANRTLGLRLPVKNRLAGNELRTRLQRIGIYRDSGHEHLNGSLIIPVLDAQGHALEVYGRKLRDDLRPGTPKHLYLPGPHCGVWNLDGVQGSEEVIVCESLIDALTFWCAGLRNVTAAYGVEGVTDELQALLASRIEGRARRVLIAFDRDEAGERGADKLAASLMAQGVDCYRVQFPKGMDANEYALKVRPAAKSLALLVRKALWLGKGAAPARMPGEQVVVEVEPTPAAAPTPAAPPVLAASVPAPTTPPTPEPMQVRDDEVVLSLAERRYRVRGLSKNLAFETMKVNLLVSSGEAYYVDTVDLYSARQRTQFLAAAGKELAVREELLKADLGRILVKLEALQEERIKAAVKVEPAVPEMSAAEREAALSLLQAPDLLARILADFEACGVVGERVNKLAGYLAATSRKLERPLAIVIQSSSAAGKSSLMDAVLAFMPEEERVQYSALTGQALFYMGETNLQHKVLAISEEEGAHRASYALKLLQSEGELTIASTGTDAAGNLVAQQYKVCGPVMLFLTTTAIDIDEELMNRCLVLSVDEGREQTAAIHRQQRLHRTLDGLIAKERKREVLALHRNAQRLLRPLAVVNPYADRLTFLDDRTRTRRDHGKYLALIDVLALLHQHQRPIRTAAVGAAVVEYVEVTLADIEQANALAHEVLGRSLDELPPQTRKLLAVVQELVQAKATEQATDARAVRFTRAEVRRQAMASDTQCRLHLERLTAMEYLLVHRGMRGQSFEYELLFDGATDEHRPRLAGLIDTAALDAATTASSRGQQGQFAGVARPQRAPIAGPTRPGSLLTEQALARLAGQLPVDEPDAKPGHINGSASSYAQALVPIAAVAQ